MESSGNPLRAAFVVAVIVFALGLASCVAADCSGAEGDSVAMENGGRAGRWIERSLYDCLLRELDKHRYLDPLRGEVRALDERRLDAFKAHLELEKRATERASQALTLAREELEDADSLWRSPWVGFIAGVALTSLAVGVTAVAVR